MIRAFIGANGSGRRRSLVLLGLAVSAGASCDSSDPLATSATSEPPAAATADSAAPADSVAPALATVSYSGLPYGPIGLWKNNGFEWGPAPFTTSQDNTYANSIITRINTARTKRQRLILAMTGGPSSDFTTNGKFDFTKWKNRMNTFKTSAIRDAVAKGVADGTIVGNTLIDEPETPKWGGVMTKPLIDKMAAYAKDIFPTLPMGINQGPPGYRWRTSERFRVLDYVLYQYQSYITDGNAGAWREAVLDRARADGVAPAFSLNILNGGTKDVSGTWDCKGTGGKGTRTRNCRMTPDQVRNFGRALGPSGCFLIMWRYDDTFMSKAANVDAFRDLASTLASKPRRSCRRP